MIVPGSVNPLLLAQGGDPLDDIARIERSVRYRTSAGPSVRRTPAAVGNRKTLVFATWVKRSEFGSGANLFSAVYTAGNSEHQLRFEATGELSFYDGSTATSLLKTTALERDPAAFYHVIFAIDTTQAAQANRGFIIVNGDALPLQASALTLNFDTMINATVAHGLGCLGSISGGQVGGYLAQPILIDGYPAGINSANWSAANIAALFGLKHPRTRQWRTRPESVLKALADAGGPNSFFLPLTDTASLAALFADASSKGNHWTATNIGLTPGVAYDSMLDTPTSNHSTLSPIDRDPGSGTPVVVTGLSNGGLSLAYNASAWDGYRSTIHVNTGKWYVEVNTTAGGATNASLSVLNSAASPLAVGDAVISVTSGSGGQTLAIALDLDAGQCTTFRNNVQVAVQPIVLGPSYCFRLCVGNGPGCHINFGQRPYTYAPPAGYKALCTKNLPFPRISKSSSAFAAVTDSGAKIRATLAAVRAGWTDSIEIIKRRDAAEGWRWIFSDDPANYMDSASAAAKAAVPAFGGTSYVGYALRVGAAYGVATGRLVHAAGVADVVADGLSTARKMVILVNEAGSSWFMFHPDCTAGKLLYLNSTAAETTDATISAVTASGFTVAAALPAGTYRWVSFAEGDGVKLFKHAANASADGPFDQLGLSPASVLLKKQLGAVAANSVVFDVARDSVNLSNLIISPNAAAAESVGTGTSLDIVSNGLKIRGAGLELNYAVGYAYVGLAFAAFPFRYANAR